MQLWGCIQWLNLQRWIISTWKYCVSKRWNLRMLFAQGSYSKCKVKPHRLHQICSKFWCDEVMHVGRECKILLVEFFNPSEKIAQRLEFTSGCRSPILSEDWGPIDQPCTEVHKLQSTTGSTPKWSSSGRRQRSLPGRPTVVPEFNRELALCVFA